VRTIALTSARESEGKTTITAQLALASAEIDAHVLLVDADLIRPSLQKLIMPGHTEPLKPGLSNYLVGGASAEEAIHPTDLPNVDIVPTGPRPPSLAGLLESRRGRAAIADLAGEAELVLLDCPPLGVGADAAVLATRVDGVILVIDMETATQESVRTALRQLENVKARVLGLVLNRDRSAEPTSGYEYLAEQAGKRGDRAAARS